MRVLLALIVEVVMGVAMAGVLLAVLVPVLSHFGLAVPGNALGTVVIAGVLVVSVGTMVLRPGSALNRRFDR